MGALTKDHSRRRSGHVHDIGHGLSTMSVGTCKGMLHNNFTEEIGHEPKYQSMVTCGTKTLYTKAYLINDII